MWRQRANNTKASFTWYNLLSNRLSNRLYNRIDNRLYRVNGVKGQALLDGPGSSDTKLYQYVIKPSVIPLYLDHIKENSG